MNGKYILLLCMFAITAHVYCECEEGTVCQTPDGEYGVCINGVCTLLSARKRENLQFAIVIKYPEETLQVSLKTLSSTIKTQPPVIFFH